MTDKPKSNSAEQSLTPLLAQYQAIKREHQDIILLFRLGDFYEMFGEDAKIGAKVLDLALTSREIGKGRRIPMCGLPFHALERYLPRLLAAGHKAAICDQTEDPKKARGLVRREVTRVLTPGTVVEDWLLEKGANNFLLSLARENQTFGLAAVDSSTGDFLLSETSSLSRLQDEIARLQPAEILLSPDLLADQTFCSSLQQAYSSPITPASEDAFLSSSPGRILCRHFEVSSLAGFGCEDMPAATRAAANALLYLQETHKSGLQQIRALRTYSLSGFMLLDAATRRNLELFSNIRDSGRTNTLLSVLDMTVTPMGARLLRGWTAAPLLQVEEIRSRQQAITSFLQDSACREKTRDILKRISDIERLVARAAAATANGRDLAALRDSLSAAPDLLSLLVSNCGAGAPLALSGAEGSPANDNFTSSPLDGACPERSRRGGQGEGEDCRAGVPAPATEVGGGRPQVSADSTKSTESTPSTESAFHLLARDADPVSDLRDLLASALTNSPPLSLRDGNLIRPGYNADLDQLHQAQKDGKAWIASLETKERERTGIKSLRVGFNQVFGYYLEISKANLSLVPEDYIRKQTLANAERFITPALKEYEALVLGAEEKIAALELELFSALREKVASEATRLQNLARLIARIDVLSTLAEVASRNSYICPEVDEGDIIEIQEGRHPVVEVCQSARCASGAEESFIPNDSRLDAQDHQLLILTGPNMAGKSTYLRQVALIVLLAQMGSFVPAKSAHIGLVDRIFTRVGAADDLASGRSTFMVEMTETANILHNATSRSLIILDEIGRGTSTFDGLSIAWAVAEYIHNDLPGAKTLFATHYHHLNELAQSLTRIKNYRIAVKEKGDNIVFLRKVVPGGTDRSYGIQVARLAGLPHSVLERAKQVLWTLEQSDLAPGSVLPNRSIKLQTPDPRPQTLDSRLQTPAVPSFQLTLFEQKENPLLAELASLDLDSLTPREALNKLAEIQARLQAQKPSESRKPQGNADKRR